MKRKKRKSKFQRVCIRCHKPTKTGLYYCASHKPKSSNASWIRKESKKYYKRLEETCKT